MQRTLQKGMAAARLDTSIDNSEDVPQTAQTPSSVSEDSRRAVTGRMPLTSEGSKTLKGQMSAARDSAESDRPARRTVRSFEEDALLKTITRPSVCRSESSSTASCNWCLGGHRSPERHSGGANTYQTAHGRKYLVKHAQRSSPGLWTVRVLTADELFQQSTILFLFFCRTG